MARNLLQMWHFYSSNQLVFGTNPNLPNIITDNLPVRYKVQQQAKQLPALESRRAFIQSDADESIR